ncbi:sugar phosphate isomerase/epimerase and 4-hydroxyphenylpyruvate domain-containing protein [Actinoplanes awajinensis]|uniref:3-dehydroshikimate dehydratase n=1 Tax=Actinoplanes awajinensis subsp. mycoplanecinus TaxID=135947 RepID=A0A101JB85_9ACTN|nr:sugar phosphate isomerase/epimerase and 4-hydroxyphenylpyruvate domain-containing protein [Actinoplanes awajinensis]KUL23599.1 4-hydroxyphenylpyruvate dioxygenase [Actinoplanes awajinensis subsp. mycoplanecinus]
MARTGIATVCLSGTLEDRLNAAAAAGFDTVEIFEADLIASPRSPEQIRDHIAGLGLTISLYQPFRDAEGAPPQRFAATRRRLRAKLELMDRLGAGTLLICSSVAPDTIADDDLAADQLRQLAELAAGHGIRIAYEALAWGRHVSTWEHSWDLVRRADHPALGLCLDSFHVLSRTDRFAGIADLPGDRIFFVQLADAPRLDMDVLQWSRHHRLFPLQGGLDLAGFTRTVLASGYAGPLSLEVFNDVFRQADPHRTAVDARRSLIALQDAVDTPGEAALGNAVSTGIAFAELGVGDDTDTGPQLETLLTALGFTHTGQHRSKPVQLWEQNTARILLNSGVHESAIHAFALESTDPEAAARRAAHLLAAPLPRRRRQSEADLTAIAAPDGTEIFFCRTAPPSLPAAETRTTPLGDSAPTAATRTTPLGQHGWLDDFLPTGETPAPTTGVTAIDHLSLAQPFDRYDEAALFYRTVLGLIGDEASEFAAPFGLIRTLAIRDPERRVRITLSVPVLRRGDWAPAVRHPQHLTLATDDLPRTASALRSAGVPLLAIPGNYYDDLDARLTLDPPLRTRIRDLGAMYDEDAHGHYLQLFTPVIGGRIFLEIVQRVGGYRGYGFVNDPVRMAAHREQRLHAHSPR